MKEAHGNYPEAARPPGIPSQLPASAGLGFQLRADASDTRRPGHVAWPLNAARILVAIECRTMGLPGLKPIL